MSKFWRKEREEDYSVGLHGRNLDFTDQIESLFDSKLKITDIHVAELKPIWVRVSEKMVKLNAVVPQGGISSLCTNAFKLPSYDKANSSCQYKGKRLRLRFSKTMHNDQLLIRLLSGRAPALKDIGHEETFDEIRNRIRPGIFFMAGATGSGKSTMLASLLQDFLDNHPLHIVTIEDPVEYLLFDGMGEVSQREIPDDVRDFPTAVKNVLREDPDVILIGEMRDAETAKTALVAAETGHLVFSTIHASGIAGIVDRLLGMMPDVNDASLRIGSSFIGGAFLSSEKLPDGKVLRKTRLLWGNDETSEKIRTMKYHDIDAAAVEIRRYS